MINITIVAVGNLKEKYWTLASDEYKKRLGAYCKINIVEVKESQANKNASKNEILQVKQKEAVDIKKHLKGYIVALEVKGKTFNSETLAREINNLSVGGTSHITFVIGGSNGMDKELSKSADMKLSFSEFTLPHQLMRVVLLEQLYRAFCINNNKTYHK
jgi:23S rRNA (pseudouridine1915-N3)-methyltransferase